MLHPELEFDHLAQALEVFGHRNDTSLILDRLHQVLEDFIRQTAVSFLAQVSGSLMEILRGPECAIGNVNVHRKASGCTANRLLWLDCRQFMLNRRSGVAYTAETD